MKRIICLYLYQRFEQIQLNDIWTCCVTVFIRACEQIKLKRPEPLSLSVLKSDRIQSRRRICLPSGHQQSLHSWLRSLTASESKNKLMIVVGHNWWVPPPSLRKPHPSQSRMWANSLGLPECLTKNTKGKKIWHTHIHWHSHTT